MGLNASRVDAMHAKSSITSTSTVRHGGLSTSTMGFCGRVGQNACDHLAAGLIAPSLKRTVRRLRSIAGFHFFGRRSPHFGITSPSCFDWTKEPGVGIGARHLLWGGRMLAKWGLDLVPGTRCGVATLERTLPQHSAR